MPSMIDEDNDMGFTTALSDDVHHRHEFHDELDLDTQQLYDDEFEREEAARDAAKSNARIDAETSMPVVAGETRQPMSVTQSHGVTPSDVEQRLGIQGLASESQGGETMEPMLPVQGPILVEDTQSEVVDTRRCEAMLNSIVGSPSHMAHEGSVPTM